MNQVQIGDKMVEVDEKDSIKCTVEEIDRGNGRVDVIVHVPCMQITSGVQTINKESEGV